MTKALKSRLLFASLAVLWLVSARVTKSAQQGLLTPAWGVSVREDIAAREYWLTWQDETRMGDVPSAWQAPNRAQGIRTYFTPDGILVVPRTADGPQWDWGLSLRVFGRGDTSNVVERADLVPDGNRIDFDRGNIVEWFVNEPQGLEHGFTLHGSPDGGGNPIGSGGAVFLDLEVDGTLTPMLGPDSRSVRFSSGSGLAVLYYGGLEVHDVRGHTLLAWMETYAASGFWTIRLLIDDREATYPIEIDPLVTTAAWTGEIDQEEGWFGASVSGAGDVNADGYDDLIVGAPGFDNGFAREGAAFLFLGSAEGPSTSYDWMIEGDEFLASAGGSVSTAGDVNGDGYDDVIVGVPFIDSGAGAWVFHGSASGLSLVPDWIGHGGAGSGFGSSVSTAGDVNGDGYDDVIVGAPIHSGGQPYEGKAYVYHGSASGLLFGASWTAEGNQANADFGDAVGAAGDINGDGYDDVIVGAWFFDNGESEEGRAFVYHGSPTGLSSTADWTYENNDVEACLGHSVDTAGDVNGDGYDDVIVGAAYMTCTNTAESPLGRAYVFHGSDSGLPSESNWIAELVQVSACFGFAAGTAGDVNNDGYDDVIVGALCYDGDQTDEGAAYVYLGSQAGLTCQRAWMVEGNQVGAGLGFVGSAGDVNGDGYDDVIVGAWMYDNPELDEGAAYVYLGGADVPAGWVPTETPLLLEKRGSRWIQLTWGPSCLGSDTDYEVYGGQVGDFTSHEPVRCSTDGATTIILDPEAGDRYYLVVPRSASSEGSYGTESDGVTQRPPGSPACLPQVIGDC